MQIDEDWCSCMSPFEKTDDGVIWRGDGETLYVQAWGRDSIRVRSVMMGDLEDTDYSLLPPVATSPVVVVEDEEGEALDGSARSGSSDGLVHRIAHVRNGRVHAVLEARTEFVEALNYFVHGCRLRILNERDVILLEDLDAGGSLELKARHFRPRGGNSFGLTVSFEAPRNEKLFGMGQYQQETFDLKGSTLELAHRNSQASVPFVVSSAGYGFLWHNPAVGKATFALNRTVWEAESTSQMDYWITVGDSPAEICAAYADATGHTPTMPDYGLGYWQCKLRYWNQEQLLEVAREHHRRGVPLDVIVADFFHWPAMGDFRFDPEFWPDPQGMIDELSAMGTQLMVSVWPQIALRSENFESLKSRNLTVRTERGMDVQMAYQDPCVFADWTNPETRQAIWAICKKNYFDMGVRMFWLDEAEPEYGVYDFDNYRYHIGSNQEVGNIYPQAYARAFFEGQRESGQKDVVNLLRCAWSGSQRFGALVWSGDIHSTWTDLRRQLVAGLHMGLAGIPWFTTDIGGFFGGNGDDPAFRELLVRWFQFGAFCPVMRMHGYREPYEDIAAADGTGRCRSGAQNEIWSFGPRVEAVLTRFITIREQLRPYLRSTMDEVRDLGGPVMRTLFYEFPEDPATWSISDEYLLGAGILVAPVLGPGITEREVYLPRGSSWRDLFTGERFEGGTTVVAAAPLDRIPVFARDDQLDDIRF